MYLNREGIQIMHQPAAHSDGDAMVFFRRSDVLVTGDILDATRFPVIDVEKGGSIQGEIAALNRIVEIAIPSIPLIWEDGGTAVIPAHGRICDQADVVEYRDMVTIIRDVVQDMVKRGMTLEQVQGCKSHQGLPTAVRDGFGPLDHQYVCRGDLQGFDREKIGEEFASWRTFTFSKAGLAALLFMTALVPASRVRASGSGGKLADAGRIRTGRNAVRVPKPWIIWASDQ